MGHSRIKELGVLVGNLEKTPLPSPPKKKRKEMKERKGSRISFRGCG